MPIAVACAEKRKSTHSLTTGGGRTGRELVDLDLSVDVPADVHGGTDGVPQPVQGVLEIVPQGLLTALGGTEAGQGVARDVRPVGDLLDIALAAQHPQEAGQALRLDARVPGELGIGDSGAVPRHGLQDAQGVLDRVVRRRRLVLERHGSPCGRTSLLIGPGSSESVPFTITGKRLAVSGC
ncbi:hypothetical protein GCM10022295_71040 [Streptomyces osmaniensis]|uniref:Uncharacterized protein n=1 Tax=Streptomyces osmaniensis TaxID=593134 RepID=A0ABP6Y938_9ACTN